jgi:hypothetical protein
MSKQQTAVEWLIEELKKVHHPTEAMIMYAKNLEREQHGKTWDAALDAGQSRAWNVMRAYEDFDDYFDIILLTPTK